MTVTFKPDVLPPGIPIPDPITNSAMSFVQTPVCLLAVCMRFPAREFCVCVCDCDRSANCCASCN